MMQLQYHPTSLCELSLARFISYLTTQCKCWEKAKSLNSDELNLFREYVHSHIPSLISNNFTSECIKSFSKNKVHNFANILLHPMITQLEVPFQCSKLLCDILKQLHSLRRLRQLIISLESPNTLRSKIRWHSTFYIVYPCGDALSYCFQSLSNLVILDVSGLQIADRVLESVGKHCPKLKQIRFCGHDPVSDVGVQSLTHCKLLEKIVIYFRDLNISDSVLIMLIQELPMLIWLECLNEEFKYVISTYELMKHLNFLMVKQETYKLKNFALVRPLPNHIDCISKLFPDMTTLSLYQPVNHLYSIAKFSQLKSLTIRHIPHLYNHVLLGALTSVSKTLEDLELYTMQTVDLLLIQENCPNLRKLKLVFCEVTYHPAERFKCNYFKKLCVLKIEEIPQSWRVDNINSVLDTIFSLSKCFVELDLKLNCISNDSVNRAIGRNFSNFDSLETLNFHSNGQLSKDLVNNIWKYNWKKLRTLFVSGSFSPEQSAYYFKKSFQTQLCIHLEDYEGIFQSLRYDDEFHSQSNMYSLHREQRCPSVLSL